MIKLSGYIVRQFIARPSIFNRLIAIGLLEGIFLIKIFILCIAILGVTGCDNQTFNELFRNPYIVEIGELDTLKAGQWHEFKTHAKALNRRQVIRVDFLGSAPSELGYEYIEPDTEGGVRHRRYYSKETPNKEIRFEIKASTMVGGEYEFYSGGRSSGIRYINKSDINMMGEVITSVKIKSNLDHENIKVTWISSTGK